MGCASSARATCRASRSASENTATVRIPMRCALRMTRQAISPRLAIRMVRNIGPPLALAPGGGALVQEGGEPLLPLVAGAAGRDAAAGLLPERGVDGAPLAQEDERLGVRLRAWGALQQGVQHPIARRLE